MLEAPHYTAAGARRPNGFALPADYFDGTVNEPVLHQAVRAFLNNQRQGTAQTKTRSFVSGGNQKPWKQKGTGRARQGSTRAPHWRGGGIVFGPQPRDYTTGIPRKVRQLARRSALNARARETGLHVVERLAFPAPKTRQLAELLGKLGVEDRKVLVLTAAHNPNAYLSGRNLPDVQVMRWADASAYDVLWADALVVEEGAITGVIPEVEPTEAEAAPAAPRKRAGKKAAAAPAKRAAPKAKAKAKAPAKAKAAKKASARGAAKKPAPKKKKGE
ncbi:MAG TPA: 50S ribosomal protein L4 [Gemmatimonadales bacterium]|jgi:large subunit ribosomal protein L4|nr:50S ribosomal protein L4 [Gemmatimonadales bacterium]